MISLLNPAILPWLLAASIPVIIHLLTRRTRRRIEIPTVQFLQRSMAQQSSLFRWRHLLLLLLRTAFVFALVLAFARPTLNSPLALPGNRDVAAVIVIDTSASMSYTDGGTSTLGRAKDAALHLLDGFGAGTKANVIFCGARPRSASGAPVSDTASLEYAVRNVQATEEKADPNAAIQMAMDQLGKAQSHEKRIYLISDFQRSNWADVKFEAVPTDVLIDFVDAAPDPRANAGVTALRLSPTTPHIGEPVTVEADVFNSSAVSRTVAVSLALSDGLKQVQSITLEPYSTATASFPLQFETAQRVECTVSIPADAMTYDDTRRIVIDLERMPVVDLVTTEDTHRPGGAAYFLARSLHPDPTSSAGFEVIPVNPETVTPAMLATADAVIVCDATGIGAAQIGTLAQYATGGGNLVWFLYGDSIAGQIAGLGGDLPPTEPIPLQVDHIEDLAGNGNGYVSLAEAHYDSPLLKAFKDPAAADLTQAHFHKICVTGEVDQRAETLLKFDDGTAAAVHSVEGNGSLLLVNMSPSPDWSDLAGQPAFVPLMNEFLKGLMSKNAMAPEFVAGGSAQASMPADTASKPGKVTCSGPDGDVPVTADPSTGAVVIDQVAHDGFYYLAKGGSTIGALSVNTDADETDLRAIDPRELEAKQKSVRTYFASVGPAADLESLGKGHPMWQYLLALGLLCLFLEQWVAHAGPKTRRA